MDQVVDRAQRRDTLTRDKLVGRHELGARGWLERRGGQAITSEESLHVCPFQEGRCSVPACASPAHAPFAGIVVRSGSQCPRSTWRRRAPTGPRGARRPIWVVRRGRQSGLLGARAVVALFVVLGFTGLRIVARNIDPFNRTGAATLTALLLGQAFINIGYVIGLLPVTGITLPLISADGNSVEVTMLAFGLLANFARHEPAALAALRDTLHRTRTRTPTIGRWPHPTPDRHAG